jgi:N,N'-diacetyllegionaminate synthase
VCGVPEAARVSEPARHFAIDGRRIGRGEPPFVVAEAGINHNGDPARALQMVRAAREAGADAVKFQTFTAAEFIGDPQQTYTYRSQGAQVTESMLAMFQRCELPRSAWRAIKAECQRQGVLFLSTPQNRSDLALLLEVGIPAVKVGSDDLTNLPLIRSYRESGLPLILSCGMAQLEEVRAALAAAGWPQGHQVALLLCTSQYPTPPADANLRRLSTLQAAFPGLVLGFSDHTQGAFAAPMAHALGAVLFEKHFTLDHGDPGPDHWFSEDPAGLAAWVAAIRAAHVMLGSEVVRPTQAELEMRVLARRSVVALNRIAAGEAFTAANVGVRRPGTGLAPERLAEVIGATAARDLEPGQAVQSEDVRR